MAASSSLALPHLEPMSNSSPEAPLQRLEKKRRRPALTCEQCRRYKIRCDRNAPCNNCTKFKIATCTYAPTYIPTSRSKKPVNHGHAAELSPPRPIQPATGLECREYREPLTKILRPTVGTMIACSSSLSASSSNLGPASYASNVDVLLSRINQLEKKLANFDHIADHQEPKTSQHVQEPVAAMRGTVSKTRFFGQSHWMNGVNLFPIILCVLGQAEVEKTELYHLFVKCKALGRRIKEQRVKPLSSINLGKTIPLKPLADQLVDAYFKNFEGVLRVLHIPTFRVEYERYWQQPDAATNVFIMQLQLCMALGAVLHDDVFLLRSMATQWIYEAQLWLLLPPEKSRMTMGGIQIMCLLNIAKASCAVGHDLIWIMTGSLIRKAMYMGLHRDPKHLVNVTIYRAEMRRRLWATILELNMQSSLDAGGAPLISILDYDTLPPANLDDERLSDEQDNGQRSIGDSNALTRMSVQLALFQSFILRLTICKYVNEFRTADSYNETLRLNSELTKACQTMTQRLAQLSQLQSKDPRCLFTSFHSSLAQLFLYRCFHALHQPMLGRSMKDPTFYYSRKVCLDSSLKIAQICGILARHHTPVAAGTLDPNVAFDRLITNGAGLFRIIPVQNLFAIALELITLKQEGRENLGTLPPLEAPELYTALESALAWTERRILAGETNIKSHYFIAACIAHADAMEAGLGPREVDQAVLEAVGRVSSKCWELLKQLAAREGIPIDETEDAMIGLEGMGAL